MSNNTEALNRNLYELLRSRGFKPKMLTTAGQPTPVPEEAAVFQFNFVKDGEEFGKVSISIDGDKKMIVYYGDDVQNSPNTNTSGTQYSDSWSSFIKLLGNWRFRNGLRKFDLENSDHLESDMARREHMRKQEEISEGYYPMGKKASYNDSTPTVKMVIQHSRQIEEGEQRYRNVARIFLENQDGERFLAPTTKPGIAKVYARHIAEGGKPHDDRWNHIGSICEEYQKMAGFVRATRGNQFNESAQKLVETGVNHYNSLRESLSKMAGHRGYNLYFESWTPPLMEDESDTTSINELFVQETLDPRIESVMPILSKLHKQVSEMAEVSALSEWADSLIEGDGGQEALNPIGIPESVDGGIDAILAQHPKAVEIFRQGGDLDYDLESDLWDYYFNQGDIKNYDADASEYIGQQLADYLGIDEGYGGQLGPTEKITKKNPLRGKLVDANENFINTVDQAVVTEEDLEEMDSEGYTGTRDDYGSGRGPDRYGKMTTAKKVAKAGLSILNKSLNSALSKEKKASPTQVEKNKARWAERQAGKEQGVAEEQVNELSKGTLKSYSKAAGHDVHADQRDAIGARDEAAHSKKHGDTTRAADWADEADWLDKRAEKRAGGIAKATTKIAQKQDMAEGQDDFDAMMRIVNR